MNVARPHSCADSRLVWQFKVLCAERPCALQDVPGRDPRPALSRSQRQTQLVPARTRRAATAGARALARALTGGVGVSRGFHVARLAADLHSLIAGTWLADAKPALLGTSLGCAVIWSYVELFGQNAVSKFIFVDQAFPHSGEHASPPCIAAPVTPTTGPVNPPPSNLPCRSPALSNPPLCLSPQAPSQWVFPDWTLGSKGIYDAASLANIQKAVTDLDSFADGNAQCCLSKPPPGTGLGG